MGTLENVGERARLPTCMCSRALMGCSVPRVAAPPYEARSYGEATQQQTKDPFGYPFETVTCNIQCYADVRLTLMTSCIARPDRQAGTNERLGTLFFILGKSLGARMDEHSDLQRVILDQHARALHMAFLFSFSLFFSLFFFGEETP